MSHILPSERHYSRVPRHAKPGELGRIIIWAGISNVLLVGLIYSGMNREAISPLLKLLEPRSVSAAVAVADPLASARSQRTDNEMLLSTAQPARKGALAMTRISLSGMSVVGEQASGVSEPPEDTADVAVDAIPSTEEVQGLKMAPVLRKDMATGRLEIGNFQPMSFAGGTDECLNIGYSMLGDTNSSNDLLEVMTASGQITIARICASNGSVVLSCRNDQITVSPRRARPDDKCERAG